MAQADNRTGFWPKNPDAKISYLPVAATQTMSAGDAIILSSGKAAIGLAASAELAGVIAQDAVTLAEDTRVACYLNPDEVFIGRMDGATSYVAGGDCDLVGATGAMELDANATSTNVFKLVTQHDTSESAADGQQWEFTINLHAFADTSS